MVQGKLRLLYKKLMDVLIAQLFTALSRAAAVLKGLIDVGFRGV
jgi:hypothetical protein